MVYKKMLALIGVLIFCAQELKAAEPGSIIQVLINQGKDLKELDTVHGMKSYLVTEGGKQNIIYVTPDGKAVLSGQMHNQNGNVTKWQLLEAAKAISATQSVNRPPVELGGPLHIGSSGPTLVAFLSPTCSVCKKFWMDKGKDIAEGKFKLIVYLVPSGADDRALAESKETILEVLSGDNPVEDYLNVSVGAGLTKPQVVTASARAQLEENMVLFQGFEFSATPAFVAQTDEQTLIKAEGWPIDLQNLMPKYNQNR